MSADSPSPVSVKLQLREALDAAMRARDDVALSSIRQALTSIAVEETAGDEQVVLTDAQVLKVLATEVRKHHETADAFVTAGRPDRVERARAEAAVLERYLPTALDDAALQVLVRESVAALAGSDGMKAMGKVIAAVREAAGPAADGAKIAAMVKQALGS